MSIRRVFAFPRGKGSREFDLTPPLTRRQGGTQDEKGHGGVIGTSTRECTRRSNERTRCARDRVRHEVFRQEVAPPLNPAERDACLAEGVKDDS